jgi:hypothetical protein
MTFEEESGEATRSSLTMAPRSVSLFRAALNFWGKGEEFNGPLFEHTQVKFQDKVTWVSLLFIPKAETNLLGRDLMCIGIKLTKKKFEISLNLMTAKIETEILPQFWTKDGNRGGLQISSIHIDVKNPDTKLQKR